MALVLTKDVMVALGRNPNDPVQFARYDLWRQGVEQAIKNWVKWEIETTTVTDYYDGMGYQDIVLRRPYVQSVQNVWVDPTGAYGQSPGAFPAASLLTAGQDYALILDGYADAGGSVAARSGLLRRTAYPIPWFPSDLLFYRGAGGLAYHRPAYWPSGWGNIKVQYTFGFTGPTAGAQGNVPWDLREAVWTGVAIASLGTAKYGFPVTSENLGAHNFSLSIGEFPEFGTVRQRLSRYRDLTV